MRYSKLVLLLALLFIILLVGCKKSVQSADNIAINQNIENIKIIKTRAIVETKNEEISEVIESEKTKLDNSEKESALINYALKGNLEGVKKLVESGVNINIKITDNDYNRLTPLKIVS